VTGQRTPSRDSIVYFYTQKGQLLSTLASDEGKFEITLRSYRTKDLASYQELTLADSLNFYAQSRVAGGYLQTLAGVRHDLEILLEQRYIPFFTVQLGKTN